MKTEVTYPVAASVRPRSSEAARMERTVLPAGRAEVLKRSPAGRNRLEKKLYETFFFLENFLFSPNLKLFFFLDPETKFLTYLASLEVTFFNLALPSNPSLTPLSGT